MAEPAKMTNLLSHHQLNDFGRKNIDRILRSRRNDIDRILRSGAMTKHKVQAEAQGHSQQYAIRSCS